MSPHHDQFKYFSDFVLKDLLVVVGGNSKNILGVTLVPIKDGSLSCSAACRVDVFWQLDIVETCRCCGGFR